MLNLCLIISLVFIILLVIILLFIKGSLNILLFLSSLTNLVILFICILGTYKANNYYIDIAIIYSILSFISISGYYRFFTEKNSDTVSFHLSKTQNNERKDTTN